MSWFAIAVKVVPRSTNPMMVALSFFAEHIPTWLFVAGISALMMWAEYKFHPGKFKKTTITLTSSCFGLFVFLMVGANG